MAEGKKLSDRALEVLQLIGEYTEWEGDARPGSKLVRVFTPHWADMHCKALDRLMDVQGPGDAAILKMLERRGLTAPMRDIGRYACAITEDGLAALADHWQDIERLKVKS